MFETKDIHLAIYLEMKGLSFNLECDEKGIATFKFDAEVSDKVDDFYNDEGGFQTYAYKIRSIKERIKNRTGG